MGKKSQKSYIHENHGSSICENKLRFGTMKNRDANHSEMSQRGVKGPRVIISTDWSNNHDKRQFRKENFGFARGNLNLYP
jgi:hypothetical protein